MLTATSARLVTTHATTTVTVNARIRQLSVLAMLRRRSSLRGSSKEVCSIDCPVLAPGVTGRTEIPWAMIPSPCSEKNTRVRMDQIEPGSGSKRYGGAEELRNRYPVPGTCSRTRAGTSHRDQHGGFFNHASLPRKRFYLYFPGESSSPPSSRAKSRRVT